MTSLANTRPKAGRKDHAVPAIVEERVVHLAMSPPPAGCSRWTTRLLAKEVSLTSGCVSDLLRRNGLKPHLVRTYKVSRDLSPPLRLSGPSPRRRSSAATAACLSISRRRCTSSSISVEPPGEEPYREETPAATLTFPRAAYP